MAKPLDEHQAMHETVNPWWTLAAVECGNFAVYMDGFIVTLALPAMARDFGVGVRSIKWVVVAYLGALTVSLLLAGRLSDLWGRRRVTIAGMIVHTLSAALCVVAPTMTALLAFRVLHGIGGALVLANVMAEISAVFPRERRRLAMGVNTSVLALAQVTGLVVGGLLTGWAGWRYIFLVAVVVGAVGLALDRAVLRDVVIPPRPGGLDRTGAILSILVVGTPFMIIERLADDPWNPTGLGLAAFGACCAALFVAVERRSPRPLLPLDLFRSRVFVCGSLAASSYFMAATSCYFLIPLYAQLLLGWSPLWAGLSLVPVSVALTATSEVMPGLAKGMSARVLTTAGLICAGTAVFLMSGFGRSTSYAHMIGPLILLGFAGGLFHPPNNTAVLAAVPPEELGVANGFFTTARNFGQAIAASLSAEILNKGLGSTAAFQVLVTSPGSAAAEAYFPAYLIGQRHAFEVAAALGIAGAIISALRGPEAHAPAPPLSPPRS